MLDLDRRWQAWRDSLQAWEDALGAELAQQRRRFRYTLIRHRVRFEREVASRTEQYWCPIKHTRQLEGVTDRYWAFLDYGDAPRWPQDLEDLRRALREDAVLDEVHFSAASAAENQSSSAADGASEKDRV